MIRRRIAMLAAAALLSITAWGQDAKVDLGLTGGLYVGDFRECGSSPLTYHGLSLGVGGSVRVDYGRMRFDDNLRGGLGAYTDLTDIAISTYSLSIKDDIAALYRFHDSTDGRLRMYAGGALSDFFTGKVNSSFENACYSVSNFFALAGEYQVEYDFGAVRADGNRIWTLFGQADLPLATLLFRPGYSYLDNFNARRGLTKNLFTSYRTSLRALGGVSTKVGISLNLKNGNKVRASYEWTYAGTGNSGAWRYDEALHGLLLTMVFNLN